MTLERKKKEEGEWGQNSILKYLPFLLCWIKRRIQKAASEEERTKFFSTRKSKKTIIMDETEGKGWQVEKESNSASFSTGV